jgi:hypothetical protein
MKARSVRSASLILVGVLATACGEVPEGARDSQVLLSERQALSCSEGDTTPPQLSTTDQEIFYECTGVELGNAWVAPEVTATDACEGAVPVNGYNTGDDDGDGVPGMIDPDDFGPGPTTEVEGLYYVQYLAWDTSYNTQGAILSVYVRDTLKPVLEFNPDNDGGDPAYEQVECFLPRPGFPDPNPYVDPGASAVDQCYGDLNQEIVTLGEVNKQIPGTYSLEYQVRDGAYNWADPVVRTVEVIDSTQPVLTQRPPIKVWPGTGWMRRVELSECVQASDRCQGDLDLSQYAYIESITVNGPSDPGDIVLHGNNTFEVRARLNPDGSQRVYTVNYGVTDSSGNVVVGACDLYVPLNADDLAP